MPNPQIPLGHSRTLVATEMFGGSPVAPGDIKNLSWSTDSPARLSLSPSTDTLSCVVTAIGTGGGDLTVTAKIADQPTIAQDTLVDAVYPVDGIAVSVGPIN